MTASTRASRRAMLRAYAETVRLEAEKKRLLPPLLASLVPDAEWIACVAQANAAQTAFVAAARAYCLSLTEGSDRAPDPETPSCPSSSRATPIFADSSPTRGPA